MKMHINVHLISIH